MSHPQPVWLPHIMQALLRLNYIGHATRRLNEYYHFDSTHSLPIDMRCYGNKDLLDAGPNRHPHEKPRSRSTP